MLMSWNSLYYRWTHVFGIFLSMHQSDGSKSSSKSNNLRYQKQDISYLSLNHFNIHSIFSNREKKNNSILFCLYLQKNLLLASQICFRMFLLTHLNQLNFKMINHLHNEIKIISSAFCLCNSFELQNLELRELTSATWK